MPVKIREQRKMVEKQQYSMYIKTVINFPTLAVIQRLEREKLF